MSADSLAKIYAAVPEVHCKGLCQQCCGPVFMSATEERLIAAKHGSIPSYLPNLRCDKLKDGKCSIYQDRPLICRLWGAVRRMQCPHGCRPKHFLPDHDARALLDRADALK